MLPQLILTATAVRVGSMVLLPNTFVTPRSLPSCGDAAADHELNKLSGVLVNVRPSPIPIDLLREVLAISDVADATAWC